MRVVIQRATGQTSRLGQLKEAITGRLARPCISSLGSLSFPPDSESPPDRNPCLLLLHEIDYNELQRESTKFPIISVVMKNAENDIFKGLIPGG